MAKVESKGQSYIEVRNQLTKREDWMDRKVKQGLFDLIDQVSLESFETRIQHYQKLLNCIQDKRLEPYLQMNPTHLDLASFLQVLNHFQYADLQSLIRPRIQVGQEKTVKAKLKSAKQNKKLNQEEKNTTDTTSSLANPIQKKKVLHKLNRLRNNWQGISQT